MASIAVATSPISSCVVTGPIRTDRSPAVTREARCAIRESGESARRATSQASAVAGTRPIRPTISIASSSRRTAASASATGRPAITIPVPRAAVATTYPSPSMVTVRTLPGMGLASGASRVAAWLLPRVLPCARDVEEQLVGAAAGAEVGLERLVSVASSASVAAGDAGAAGIWNATSARPAPGPASESPLSPAALTAPARSRRRRRLSPPPEAGGVQVVVPPVWEESLAPVTGGGTITPVAAPPAGFCLCVFVGVTAGVWCRGDFGLRLAPVCSPARARSCAAARASATSDWCTWWASIR